MDDDIIIQKDTDLGYDMWYEKHQDDLWAEYYEQGAYTDYEEWCEARYFECVKEQAILWDKLCEALE